MDVVSYALPVVTMPAPRAMPTEPAAIVTAEEHRRGREAEFARRTAGAPIGAMTVGPAAARRFCGGCGDRGEGSRGQKSKQHSTQVQPPLVAEEEIALVCLNVR